MAADPSDLMDMAERVLSLAQQTADYAIADTRLEAHETLGWTRREADEIVTRALREAEQIKQISGKGGNAGQIITRRGRHAIPD